MPNASSRGARRREPRPSRRDPAEVRDAHAVTMPVRSGSPKRRSRARTTTTAKRGDDRVQQMRSWPGPSPIARSGRRPPSPPEGQQEHLVDDGQAEGGSRDDQETRRPRGARHQECQRQSRAEERRAVDPERPFRQQQVELRPPTKAHVMPLSNPSTMATAMPTANTRSGLTPPA